MRPPGIVLPILLVSACATNGMAEDQSPTLTAKQQATLTKALEGKVADKPQSCMSMIPRADLQVISDDVLLYKIGRTVYVNRMMGNCSGLTNGRSEEHTSELQTIMRN